MLYQWLKTPKAMIVVPVLLAFLFAVACGAAAKPTPAVEKRAAPVAPTVAPAAPKAPAAPAAPKAPAAPAAPKAPEAKPPTAVPTPIPARAKVPEWVSIGAKKHYKGVLRFIHRANPGFLDLHYGASSTTVLLPSGPRFNQLLQYDPTSTQEIIGDLAESWEVKDGGKTYIFHIADATWQDGTKVTADDVVFSLDRMAQPGVTRGRVTAIRDFYQPGTATAIDAKTVKMPLKSPSATALSWLAVDYFKIYARHVVENKTQDQLNCCFENNVGSGPWKFKEWKKGDSWEHERYDNYFKSPIPFYDGMKVFVIEDAARRLASMKTGQVHAWLVMGGTTLQDMLQVQKETGGKMRATRSGAGSVRGFWFHWNRPPLDDPRVRKAIYLALDRQEIEDITFKGEAIVGDFFPPGYLATQQEILQLPGFRRPKDQDVAEAKRLMVEAGYADGFKLTFNVDQSRDSRTEAELIAAQLKAKLNIDIDIQVADRATMYKNLRDGTHNLSTIGTGLYFLHPQTVLVQWFAKDTLRNPHNWEHPRLNELMQAEAKELDPQVRRGLYKEMAQILNQGDSHFVVLGWTDRAGSIDYRIQNFKPPFHPHTLWRWDQIWWDPDAKIPGPDAPPIE